MIKTYDFTVLTGVEWFWIETSESVFCDSVQIGVAKDPPMIEPRDELWADDWGNGQYDELSFLVINKNVSFLETDFVTESRVRELKICL